MPSLPANRDTSTLQQLCALLWKQQPQMLQASMGELRTRFPHLPPLVVSLNTDDYAQSEQGYRLSQQDLYGFGVTQALVAGQLNFVQLFNPLASGVNVEVFSASAGSSTSLVSIVAGIETGGVELGALQAPLRNLSAGGPASSVHLNAGAQVGAPVNTPIWNRLAPVNIMQLLIVGNSPLVFLPPGTGFTLYSATIATALYAELIWSEVNV